jgi:CopG family nickel-responsive transcriptional regulator
MQRVTISIDEDLATEFDALIAAQGYQSRSEAVRDLVRRAVDTRRLSAEGGGFSVASLSYVYDHHTRALAQRLVDIQHNHHDVVVATMHVHLDHESCLENAILKGPTKAVQGLADLIQAERGVRYAKINMISTEPNGHHHHHHHDDHQHPQGREAHASPRRG